MKAITAKSIGEIFNYHIFFKKINFDFDKYMNNKEESNHIFSFLVSEKEVVGFISAFKAPNNCLSINVLEILTEYKNEENTILLLEKLISQIDEHLNQKTCSVMIYCFLDEDETDNKIWFNNAGFYEAYFQRTFSNGNKTAQMYVYKH